MAAKRSREKKHYTIDEANAMLPLLRSILRDITELAVSLRERDERLSRARVPAGGGSPYSEETEQMEAEFERDRERLNEYIEELRKLKVELKDPFIGLVDFPYLKDGREVYLCWKLGEPQIAFWHELDKGFAGRQKL
jgi:hypothetical protein